MSKEMPEWLEKEYFKIDINEPDSLYNGFKKCFEILSKPENQARMPETKALVEALYMYAEELDWDRVNTFATINERGKRAKQALKLFGVE